MGVYIKGMEMSESCSQCNFCQGFECVVLKRTFNLISKDDCPLIEVPPHGRLIDADAMNEKYGDWYTEEGTEEGFIGALKYLIAEQPIIIEEEGT